MKAITRTIGWNDLTEKKRKEITRSIYEEQKTAAWESIAKYNDAIIMFTLVEEFGFNKYDCRKLFDSVSETRVKISKEFLYSDEIAINDVAEIELKQIGVDLEQWRNLKKMWKPENDKVWQSRD